MSGKRMHTAGSGGHESRRPVRREARDEQFWQHATCHSEGTERKNSYNCRNGAASQEYEGKRPLATSTGKSFLRPGAAWGNPGPFASPSLNGGHTHWTDTESFVERPERRSTSQAVEAPSRRFSWSGRSGSSSSKTSGPKRITRDWSTINERAETLAGFGFRLMSYNILADELLQAHNVEHQILSNKHY
ncbi:hypothetical protein CYMTET_21119 [Cymbomonas tetramitiformis]|uniref:Uncharacterized protein n=1 Tax=Cymbomonas tetramitiformis TaxID=36881 RepID=A0AAE0G407_9CHLO|nr:hypothetical protein CYMTET_21119 [Cymbomonas tetramitiformis]